MINLSLFAERLNELIFDNKTTAVIVAKKLSVPRSTISRYLNAQRMPGVDMLTKLADILHCSVSFLMGLEENNYFSPSANPATFISRLNLLLAKKGVSKYKLVKDTKISESALYLWQRGAAQPNIESIIKLAEYFGCSVDYLIGREY